MATNLIWNYDDVDTGILKVSDNDLLLGYFRMDNGTFTFVQRRVHSLILTQIINEYDEALKQAQLIAEK
jgi:hypothetical protein